jgi:hypothetical protein
MMIALSIHGGEVAQALRLWARRESTVNQRKRLSRNCAPDADFAVSPAPSS